MDPQVSLLEQDDLLSLKLRGDARVEAAALLLQQAAQADLQKDVAVDWEEAEHVETSVFQVLLAIQKRLTQHGRSLIVEKDNPHVRDCLQLAGLSDSFPVQPAQALATSRGNNNA